MSNLKDIFDGKRIIKGKFVLGDAGYIFDNEGVVLNVRMWGRLTSKYTSDEAAEIQDKFGQWVVDTLNKERNN